jgi:hypothetical protein
VVFSILGILEEGIWTKGMSLLDHCTRQSIQDMEWKGRREDQKLDYEAGFACLFVMVQFVIIHYAEVNKNFLKIVTFLHCYFERYVF